MAFGEVTGKEMRKITFITIFLVLFFNIGACILYAESYRTAGLILKGLGDGISLIYICTQAILMLSCH
ncbi:hypothetical protein [Blautia faecis]|uniref:hypothetical protein n=1 Tax=Blautia faecis TaxID=871665 RepID=UPI0022E75851|nr:hypothetical protein [Blautia faecis]